MGRTYTSFLLLLGLALYTVSASCPDHGSLPSSCECEDDFLEDKMDAELSCSGSTIEELRDAVGVMDKNIRLQVFLDDMRLDPLPSDIFNGWNVVKLEISHCELDNLSYEGQVPLAGLEDKLEVLSIMASFTEENQQTKLDFSHLNRLKELDLSYNAITELSDDWFARGPASLLHLVLSNNGISKIGDQAFANLENLDKLELHGNRFGPLKRSMLPRSAEKLAELELDNNDFETIPDDLFTDMPALMILSIRTNRIRCLPEKAFRPIWPQLEIFDARGNPLQCDSAMEWMFRVETDASLISGTCEGPEGREGTELDHFIRTRGQ